MSLIEEWILNKVKLAFAGSVTLIMLLGASNIWLFTTITSLQSDKSALTSQIQTLQNQADSLSNELGQKNSQILTLQNQVDDLSNQTDILNQNYLALNQSYTELQRQYEDLLFHYNLLNKPASNFTTINDLNITLAVDRTTYYYKDPVSGNATIKYLNGTPFEGSFVIGVAKSNGGSRIGWTFYLQNGYADFNIESPVFSWGPGSYIIKIYWIYTIDGFIVADPNTAGLPEVQVEVK
jgi:hypothetical protein